MLLQPTRSLEKGMALLFIIIFIVTKRKGMILIICLIKTTDTLFINPERC